VEQPVIIGGTMGTSSYIMAENGEQKEPVFFSACHEAKLARRVAKLRPMCVIKG
jgi:RNA-splicing ligase RtcB